MSLIDKNIQIVYIYHHVKMYGEFFFFLGILSNHIKRFQSYIKIKVMKYNILTLKQLYYLFNVFLL